MGVAVQGFSTASAPHPKKWRAEIIEVAAMTTGQLILLPSVSTGACGQGGVFVCVRVCLCVGVRVCEGDEFGR